MSGTAYDYFADHQKNLVRRVETVIDELHKKAKLEEGIPQDYRVPGEFSNLVGLAGGRGSGKTSLLYGAVHTLSKGTSSNGRRPYLVLRPITGRELLAGHSLFGTVLSRLSSVLRFDPPGRTGDQNDQAAPSQPHRCAQSGMSDQLKKLRNCLDGLRDAHIKRTVFSRDNLLKGVVSPSDFSWSFNQLFDKEAEAAISMRDFIKGLLDHYGHDYLIVPVDDCDIYPELLPGLFDDLLLLSGSGLIVTILAYDPDVMRAMIGHRLLSGVTDQLRLLGEFDAKIRDSFLQQIKKEEVTYFFCHKTSKELIDRIAKFQEEINLTPYELADRLWVKDTLDSEVEKLRIPP